MNPLKYIKPSFYELLIKYPELIKLLSAGIYADNCKLFQADLKAFINSRKFKADFKSKYFYDLENQQQLAYSLGNGSFLDFDLLRIDNNILIDKALLVLSAVKFASITSEKNKVILIDRFNMPVSYNFSQFEKLIITLYGCDKITIKSAWIELHGINNIYRIDRLTNLLASASESIQAMPVQTVDSAFKAVIGSMLKNPANQIETTLINLFISESTYQAVNSWDYGNDTMMELIKHTAIRNALLIGATDKLKETINTLYNEQIELMLLNHFNDCVQTIAENITDELPIISLIIDATKQAETIQAYLDHYPD